MLLHHEAGFSLPSHWKSRSLSFAKGMLLRHDPDREGTGRILRDALAHA